MNKESLYLLPGQWEVTSLAERDAGAGCWSGRSAPYASARETSRFQAQRLLQFLRRQTLQGPTILE